MYDMNDADAQKTGGLIPDGAFAKVAMTIRPGGLDGAGEIDRGILKAPKDSSSDVRMLDCEFTIMEGPHARRKFWQMFIVRGGKVDENGVSIAWKISKSAFRAMIDSALGLNPEDMSDEAKAKRILRGLADLNGITFVAKIKVDPASDPRYGDQNRIDFVVLPNEKEWALVMEGKDVSPGPSRRKKESKPGVAPHDAQASAPPAWSRPAAANSSAPAHATSVSAPLAWKQTAAAASVAAPAQPAANPSGPAWLNG